MQIYLARNNQQAGPYTLEQLNQMLDSQQVLLTDLAWHQGMTNWKSLGELTQGKLVYQPNPAEQSPSLAPQDDKQPLTTPTQQVVTASVKRRIAAKLIDLGLYIIPPMILLMLFIPHDLLQQTAHLGMSEQIKLAERIQKSMPQWLPWLLVTYTLALLLVQNILIGRSGQSIGKKVFKLQIVDATNFKPTSQFRAFFIRSFSFVVLSQLMGIFPFLLIIFIADIVLFFGKGNNSLHDRIAKTTVININKS